MKNKDMILKVTNVIFLITLILMYFLMVYKTSTKPINQQTLDAKDNNTEEISDDIFYFLTLSIQICFSFGLSGLFSHKNLIKLGVF